MGADHFGCGGRNQDQDELKTLFKIWEDVGWKLDEAHIQYLLNKMRSIDSEEYVIATLDLLKELSRISTRHSAAADGGAVEILWNLVQDGSKASQEVISHARVKLEEILNDYSYRVSVLLFWLVGWPD